MKKVVKNKLQAWVLPTLTITTVVGLNLWLRPPALFWTSGDEVTTYRLQGLDFVHHLPFGPAGPLYMLEWWLESHVTAEPHALAALHWGLLLAGCLGVLWCVLRRAGVPGSVAAVLVICASGLRWSNQGVHVGLLATIVLGVGLLLGWHCRRVSTGIAWLTAGAIMAAFIRPEFALSSGLLIAAALWSGARRELLPAAALAAGLVLIFGSHLAGGRRWAAFCQHYAIVQAEARGEPSEPMWLGSTAICATTFGPTTVDVGAAVMANPAAVASHIERNLRRIPHALVELVSPADIAALPSVVFVWGTAVLPTVILIALGFGLLLAALIPQASASLLWIGAAAVGAPIGITALLIMPDARYFVPMLPFVIGLAACGWATALNPLLQQRASGAATDLPVESHAS